ncbi:EAL domain-containing response regulator [uncultured Erythrobacter sp.]|uniref:EAL domain-containing response regulator n=1 Tax=uncultured Erythrobacter sp. TaxID=263913 RepID=UPI0026581872|nr:EAL domain-containing response regulator [uncultured Erythrobacter sp.]
MPHLKTSATETADCIAERRLLILDDDPAVLRTVELMARRIGVVARTCSTLADFEASLASFDPDVLLIDLMMPDLDGIDVVSQVGPNSRATIIVMSGADKRTYEASRDVLASSTAKIAGFLHKPFGTTDLAEVLSGSPAKARPCSTDGRSDAMSEVLSPKNFEEAVRAGRIEPFFQPIFYADGRGLKGFEALARVKGSQASSFAPEYLDQLVADDRLSAELTELVIERALEFMASLRGYDDLSISINIFGIHAIADGFRERLVRRCTNFGIARHRVILELSEATIFDLNEHQLRKVTQLRLAGFGLSIDDFGMGNSSLGRLAHLPFSELKIDKAFCLAMPHSETASAVIEACLGLAARLDMKVTAEGVETGEVAALLAKMGCDALQGHHFGQAMSADKVLCWLNEVSPKVAA